MSLFAESFSGANRVAHALARIIGIHEQNDVVWQRVGVGIEGLALGEQVALSMLADETRTYNEDFGGYELTTFDGDEVLIADGEIYPI